MLSLIRIEPSLGKGPQNLLITPDGKWLLCANMPAIGRALANVTGGAGTAGAGLGHTVYAAVASTPAFQDDLALARVEVTAARTAAGPESPGCAAERQLFPSDG